MVLSPNYEEVASSKKKHIQTKLVEIDTLFKTKKNKKPYSLAPHTPI